MAGQLGSGTPRPPVYTGVMAFSLFEVVLLVSLLLLSVLLAGVHLRTLRISRDLAEVTGVLGRSLDAQHLALLRELNSGLAAAVDRVNSASGDRADQFRAGVEQQLRGVRDGLASLRVSTDNAIAAHRESVIATLGSHREAVLHELASLRAEMVEKSLAALAEQGRSQAASLQETVRALSQQLSGNVEALTRTVDGRLEQIQGRVGEKLEEGFRKTNETFTSVMARLATIDEAQRKIDGLTTNVVSLQELLGDKRSRGAFGEVQLENLVRNLLPATAYEFQHTLSNGHRADCVLRMPEPTGLVAVDAKFPLENYHRMFDLSLGEVERRDARRAFRADVRKHVDDIASRYVVAGETSDGAVMFVPAEAVFAEIHGYHGEVVDHAMSRHVWIVSPTTMMAVLNTARAVLKDVETRRQVHVIKDELAKLGKDFGRFDERMRKLAAHIRQAHEDAENVQISSDKIVRRFRRIEEVELDPEHHPAASLAMEEPADDTSPATLAVPADLNRVD